MLGLFLLALTTTVPTKAVDNPGHLPQRLPGCLVCVLWDVAAGRVWCEGWSHHGVSLCSEADPTALGLSVAVFSSSLSSLFTPQRLCEKQIPVVLVNHILVLGDTAQRCCNPPFPQ